MTKLKNWMEAQSLTNGEMARRMEVSPALVSLFATGNRTATDSFKWRFGEIFGFDEARAVFDECAETETEHVA